jgi:hypothetical protein
MPPKLSATWKLIRRPDGLAGVEIRTAKPLEPYVSSKGNTFEPSDYLTWGPAFHIGALGPGRTWRYLKIQSDMPGAFGPRAVYDFIDLSAGSPDRELVALICEQDHIPVMWVTEGLEISWEVEPGQADSWRMALENTKGVSAADYHEELEDVRWYESPSYRPGQPRPRPYKRRTATLPTGLPAGCFARRSGVIPKNGQPEINGVTLPKGSRKPSRAAAYWATDEPVENRQLLIPWLTSQFPETGLWPVLWRAAEDPGSLMGGGHDMARLIDDIDVAAYLATRHAEQDLEDDAGPFTGLAEGEPPGVEDRVIELVPASSLSMPARVLLVPCNRPADAVTALGGVDGVIGPEVISAILRSWEQRFGAIFFEAVPGLTRLHVARPPHSFDQALAVSHELHAIDEVVYERAGDLQQTAHVLLGADSPADLDPGMATITADNWDVGW